MNKKIVILLIIVTCLFSCQTGGKPRWITDPPEDDSLNIYLVGYGYNSDLDLNEMKASAFQNVLSEIYSRFSVTDDEFLEKVITAMLDTSFKEATYTTDQKVAIIDRWHNNEELYILVRIRKSFFDPLLKAYTERYDDMITYTHQSESDGDALYEDGMMYKAYLQYLSSLEDMLEKDEGFYIVSISRVLDKIMNIFKSMHYSEAETFSSVYIGEPYYLKGEDKPVKRLFFEILGEKGQDYSGFSYEVAFSEGWNNKDKSALVKVIDNGVEFVPPRPKVSGIYTISSEIFLDDIITRLNSWRENSSSSYFVSKFLDDLAELKLSTQISFNYNAESDLGIRPKIISFGNQFINEGVVRYLLENEDSSEAAPYSIEDEVLISYVREINLLTQNKFSYLVLGYEVSSNVEDYGDGIMIKLATEFSVIDLKNSKVILTRKVNSEFIGVPGEEDLAFLDLGLKIGELISQIKF